MLTCSLVQHCVCKAPCTGKQLPAKEGAVPRGAKTAKSIKMSTVICEWFGCDVFERTTMMTMTSACLEMMTSLAKGLSKRQTEAFGELLFSPRVFRTDGFAALLMIVQPKGSSSFGLKRHVRLQKL